MARNPGDTWRVDNPPEDLALETFAPDEASEVFEPPVEILQSDDEVMIRVSLPGVEAGDVHVTAAEDDVEIAGVIREPGPRRVVTSELRYGVFRRRVRLPVLIDPDRGLVVLRSGILRIALPRLRCHA